MPYCSAAVPPRAPFDRLGRTPVGRLLLPGIVALLLVACSRPALVYERLDWIAHWRLSDYVSLERAQRTLFDTRFRTLWDWHRAEELPRYAADLREMSRRLDETDPDIDFRTWQSRAELHWDRLVAQALPAGCELLSGLSDGQVRTLLARLDDDLQDARKRYLAAPPEKVRQRAERRLLRQMERWVGRLSPEQRAAAQQWNAQRPVDHAGWIDRRQDWRDALASLLAERREAAFCGRAGRLWLRAEAGDGLSRPLDDGAQAWHDFLSGVLDGLSAPQRQHLQRALNDLAENFDTLAQRS